MFSTFFQEISSIQMKASWTLLNYQSVIQTLKQEEYFPFSLEKKVLLYQLQRESNGSAEEQLWDYDSTLFRECDK